MTARTSVDEWPGLPRLVPLPALLEPRSGSLVVTARTRIAIVAPPSITQQNGSDIGHLLTHLVGDVQQVCGAHLEHTTSPQPGDIVLRLDGDPADHGPEGYSLTVGNDGAELRAATLHGLWNGSRTLLQLFAHEAGNGTLPCVHIVDRPRFESRGVMLDVARHFFGVDHVMRFVELLARFKINRLHLHLSDDQGWRLAIDGWPALTGVGASTSVGGGTGGYLTRDDYAEIVAHAARHFITIVPEIDMPGHTNAALSAVPELNLDGVTVPAYFGKGVGFSSLHLAAPATARFVRDVIAQLAADTPGRWLHIGGDEANATDHAEYAEFIGWVHGLVRDHGKQMIGWEEIATTPLAPGAVVQHWLRSDLAALAPADAQFVMSPAAHCYLDMRHTAACTIGRRWAGFIDVDTIYDWDPAAMIDGVGDDRILGVEAALWTEKVASFAEVEHLCFPRLVCLAEVGWTPQRLRDWSTFRPRLRVQADRLAASGVLLYRSALLAE